MEFVETTVLTAWFLLFAESLAYGYSFNMHLIYGKAQVQTMIYVTNGISFNRRNSVIPSNIIVLQVLD